MLTWWLSTFVISSSEKLVEIKVEGHNSNSTPTFSSYKMLQRRVARRNLSTLRWTLGRFPYTPIPRTYKKFIAVFRIHSINAQHRTDGTSSSCYHLFIYSCNKLQTDGMKCLTTKANWHFRRLYFWRKVTFPYWTINIREISL